MVYNVVSQADLELASNATHSDASRGPSPQTHPTDAFQQLSLHTENTAGNQMEPAGATSDFGLGHLDSLMRSMADTSYDLLEGDDYEAADSCRRSGSLHLASHLETTARSINSASRDPPLHSPSTDHPVPLSHPTPDLQSLQGAYLGNVERLERSAECLSSSSVDIGSEIRKMDREQKQRSSSSAANSIAAGGGENEFSPTGPASLVHGTAHTASRLRSVSGSQLAQVTEPEHGHGHDFPDRPSLTLAPPRFQAPAPDHRELNQDQFDPVLSGKPMERRSTTASNDTYQQARKLFADFDGVHFVTSGSDRSSFRNVPLTRPPLAAGSESHKEPQSGENMVYYPAPVPMMLNLPPRLSRRPAAEQEKRRTQLLGSAPLERRKSAPRLSGQGEDSSQDHEGKGRRRSKPVGDLPPQLRASVVFEPPAGSVDVQPKQASAVATLESILDASAHAPVTAFTDHPFAGRLGSEVYGSANNKARSKGLADPRSKRRSLKHDAFPSGRQPSSVGLGDGEVDAADVHEGTSLRTDASSSRGHDDDSGSSTDGGTDSAYSSTDQELEDSDEDPGYVGPPNTLLAELQLRKQELKHRRRTAANSVGLQATLLELDTVAQKQSERRRQKRITLAWEAPHPTQPEDEDNEDVPLAMLYPHKANLPEDARPMGLLEKREMEDREPLSKRRARLRRENPVGPPDREERASVVDIQGAEAAEPDSGDEGETLGQRQKRLKAENRTSAAAESEFTAEVLAEIGHLKGDGEDDDNDQDGTQEEETLAQRRARLQMQAKMERGIDSKEHTPRKSMAELSQVRPATGSRRPSYEPMPHRNSIDPRFCENRMPVQAPSQYGPAPLAGYSRHADYATTNPSSYKLSHPNTFYSDAVLGMNSLAYAMSGSYPKAPKPEIEPGQREIINRWRQSIK